MTTEHGAHERTTVPVRTRWDDCDRYGHVNNAAYLALLREATERALRSPEGALGRIGEVEITYREPVPPGVEVSVALQVVSEYLGLRTIDYVVRFDGIERAVATVRWRQAVGARVGALPELTRDVGGVPFTFPHLVRSYELGPDGEVRPSVVLQWLEHAVFRAALRVGWTHERMRDADFVTLQIGHHLVLDEPARGDDELVVASRLIEMRRVSGIWHHEVRHADGSLVAADRSRGAFLDLAGRVRQAPRDLIASLLRGEPADGAP